MGKAKPGRKRRPGKREANGKLSRRVVDKQARRTIDEQSAMSVAKEARLRLFGAGPHGLREEDVGTELAGSVVGRLFLAGDLQPEQLTAARLLVDTYASYQRTSESPRPPKAVNIGGTSGSAPETTPEQTALAQRQWRTIVRVLTDVDCLFRGRSVVYAACEYLVLRDLSLPHLVPDLRLGLNAIACAYGLRARAA